MLLGGLENIARRDKPLAAHTTFRIGGPAEALVVPRGVDRTGSRPAARRELARTQPVNRSRQPTPGHRSEVTPNPDMGEPED